MEEIGEFPGEGRGKLWSPIRDHLGMSAKSRKDVGKNELGYPGYVDVFVATTINYPLNQTMVYHNHE